MKGWLPDRPGPATVLAPMQDITHHAFLSVLTRRGDPDWYVTEYFRVYPDSRPDPGIARAFRENPTGRPVVAQMIGRDIPDLVATARTLVAWGAAGIDLNLGCPAPIVCRKDAGGGLLRHPDRIDEILTALRAAIDAPFTVKTRVGYDHPDEFPRLLDVFQKHAIDGLAVHGRTVRDGYATPVHESRIADAVQAMPCPVIANGNAVSAATAMELQRRTGAAGVMIGRGAIRNPFLFRQIAESAAGQTAQQPTLRDLLDYTRDLWQATILPGTSPRGQVNSMKRYLKFIAEGIGPDNAFLEEIRRVESPDAFHESCERWLDHPHPAPDLPPADSRSFRGFAPLLP